MSSSSSIELRKSQSTIKREIAFKYVPLASTASLTAFASTLMDPSMFSKFGSWGDTVRNSLWISSCAGVGMWLFDRPHMKRISSEHRRAAAALGIGSLFVQGSLLTCAFAKRLSGDAIPHSVPRMILGASIAGGCIKLGKSYIDMVDSESEEVDYDAEEEEEEEDDERETVAAA